MPLHPMIVHLPVALAVLMPLAAAGLLLAWWRGYLPRRTFAIAAILQALLVGSSFVALRSGEDEEERVERVVPERAIHVHEEAAEGFLWGTAVVLVVMLGAAAVRSEKAARALAAAGVVGTLVVAGLAYRVGDAGAQLVYRHGAASAYGPAAPAGTSQRPLARDDDD